MRTNLRTGAGFSLLELLIAMAVTMLIMTATFSAMTQAMRSTETAKLLTGMNTDLRVAVDLMVRDLTSAGQGLPTSHAIDVPNGPGSVPILRPGPPDLTFDVQTNMPAVTVGAELGGVVNGVATDIITILAVDSTFDRVPLRALTVDDNSGSITVAMPADASGGVDIDANVATRIREGDLIMLTKGSASTLLFVTGIDTEGPQRIFFEDSNVDTMDLNQFDLIDNLAYTPEMLGTMNQLARLAPVDPIAPTVRPDGTLVIADAQATRIRMITYYLDTATDPNMPRLMRQINHRDPTAVAFALENVRLTYDIVNGNTNPKAVRMTAADLDNGGACGSACDPNQIIKVNLLLAGRSRTQFSQTGLFLRNTLHTQVSLRNLAFVDEYQ